MLCQDNRHKQNQLKHRNEYSFIMCYAGTKQAMNQTPGHGNVIPNQYERGKDVDRDESPSFSFSLSAYDDSEPTRSMSSTASTCTISTYPSSDSSEDQAEVIHTQQQVPNKKAKKRSRGRRRRGGSNKKGSGAKQRGGLNQKNVIEVTHISDEDKAKYVAIDCEMVSVRGISTIARVSIVDWNGEIIFNSFVRVEDEVTDYLTFVSGIRQADIESEDAMSFEDCQDAVLEIISGKIVVGHALRNDFIALNIMHPWYLIRDTARYEPFMKPCLIEPNMLVPKKLKVLAKNKLDMTIQEHGQEHDSIEDATAAMELYKKARTKWESAMQWKMRKTSSIEKTKRCF